MIRTCDKCGEADEYSDGYQTHICTNCRSLIPALRKTDGIHTSGADSSDNRSDKGQT